MDALKQDNADWIKQIYIYIYIYNIINKYNATEHTITQIKPNEAVKPDNHLWVNWHLQNAAKNNRKHPELKDGDMVRFKLKPSIGTKGHEPKWSSTRHKTVGNSTDNR